MEIRLKLFFAQSFLSASSVSTEQSQTCVKSAVAVEQEQEDLFVVAEQSDTLFASADLLIMTPTPSIEIPAQENLLQKHKERVEKLPQPDQLIKIWTGAGFLKTVEIGQYFLTNHTDEFLQFAEPGHVVSVRYHETTNQLTRKVRFKGTPKLDLYWKSQTVTCKVNMKSELNLLTKTILTRGSEFLIA